VGAATRGAEHRFDELVDRFAGRPGVRGPGESGRRGFGSTALTVNGSIFAMLTRGELVVKLPRDEVAALIQTGAGRPFDSGKGTPMREWVWLAGTDDATWTTAAEQAYDFVRSGSQPR